MKKWNKFTALFLALVMSFSLAVPAGAVETEDNEDTTVSTPNTESDETTTEPTPEEPTEGETPEEPTDEPTDEPAEYSGRIVILHTNDIHGAIDGYALAAALKESYEEDGDYVILADAGDYIQGDPVVSVSQGATAVELMALAGYDIATLGNHEFDYGYENLKTILADAPFTVVAANVLYQGEYAFQNNAIYEAPDGTKIGFFGLDTPETATKSHPAKIQGVTFLADQALYDCAQNEVDALREAGCDYVICLGHLGIDDESLGNRSVDLLENVTGIDVFIDGHSHSTLTDIIEAGYGQVNDTFLTSNGTKDEEGTTLTSVGIIEIDAEGLTIENFPVSELDPNLLASYDSYNTVLARAAEIKAEVEADYGAVFAKTEVALDGEKAQVRSMETNLGNLITDAMLWAANELGEPVDAAVTNGGGIRASIAAGDITKKDINTVLPFGNTLYMVEVTGAELLEALEASTYCTPETIGGFPQVAGITYTVDTYQDFASSENYPDSTYGKPDVINRVSIQTVGGAEFDAEETYTIVTNDFLGAGGDTYYAFAASPIGYDLGVPMDEVVMDYITTVLNGTVTAKDYGKTEGRATVIHFNDVADTDYFAEAVEWAVENGITSGTSATTFAPKNPCTRGQIVTFLWRAAGQPAPETTENPFSDVVEGAYYYDAVLWAVENGITNGTSATTFGPDKTVNRGQTVTFLHRAAGEPVPTVTENPFTDVAESQFYYDAVLWAVENEVTNGTSETTFGPKNPCTRGQIVTFLFRADSVPEPVIHDEAVLYELVADEEVYVVNEIFNADVTVTGDMGAIVFENCTFNADVINEGEVGTRVVLIDSEVIGTCYIINDSKEATIYDPLPKFVTNVPVDVVVSDCVGSLILEGDVPVTFNGEAYTMASVDTYVNYGADGTIELVPYEDGMDVDIYYIGQWWEGGKHLLKVMGESTDPVPEEPAPEEDAETEEPAPEEGAGTEEPTPEEGTDTEEPAPEEGAGTEEPTPEEDADTEEQPAA